MKIRNECDLYADFLYQKTYRTYKQCTVDNWQDSDSSMNQVDRIFLVTSS